MSLEYKFICDFCGMFKLVKTFSEMSPELPEGWARIETKKNAGGRFITKHQCTPCKLKGTKHIR